MVDTSWRNSATLNTLARPMNDRRRIVDRGWDHNRYPPAEDAMGARSPPKTVEQALKDCHIEAKEYFLATLASNGVVKYFISSPKRLGQRDIRTIFNEPQFRHALSGDGPAANSIEPSGFHENAQVMGGHSYNSRSPGTTNPQHARPRARTNANRRNVPDETMPPPTKRIPLMIGNSDAVYQFYIDQFKRIQQTACKLIAKAWIKTVAPKKQSTHPYTGQAIPAWWPKPWGETPFDVVRHKEPDHLKKAHSSLCPYFAARHRAQRKATPRHSKIASHGCQTRGGRTRCSLSLFFGKPQQRSQETLSPGAHECCQDGGEIQERRDRGQYQYLHHTTG